MADADGKIGHAPDHAPVIGDVEPVAGGARQREQRREAGRDHRQRAQRPAARQRHIERKHQAQEELDADEPRHPVPGQIRKDVPGLHQKQIGDEAHHAGMRVIAGQIEHRDIAARMGQRPKRDHHRQHHQQHHQMHRIEPRQPVPQKAAIARARSTARPAARHRHRSARSPTAQRRTRPTDSPWPRTHRRPESPDSRGPRDSDRAPAKAAAAPARRSGRGFRWGGKGRQWTVVAWAGPGDLRAHPRTSPNISRHPPRLSSPARASTTVLARGQGDPGWLRVLHRRRIECGPSRFEMHMPCQLTGCVQLGIMSLELHPAAHQDLR